MRPYLCSFRYTQSESFLGANEEDKRCGLSVDARLDGCVFDFGDKEPALGFLLLGIFCESKREQVRTSCVEHRVGVAYQVYGQKTALHTGPRSCPCTPRCVSSFAPSPRSTPQIDQTTASKVICSTMCTHRSLTLLFLPKDHLQLIPSLPLLPKRLQILLFLLLNPRSNSVLSTLAKPNHQPTSGRLKLAYVLEL